MSVLDVSGYVATDPFFGAPYLDADEERSTPIPHRFVHGGFEGTATRFSLSFPTDGSYQGRLLQPLEGAHGGHENALGSELVGDMIGGLRMTGRLGAFMAESNQGHIGDDLDPKGGDDPTLYGHRASAEVARLAKFVAVQVYGQAPHHSYIWGGSGGRRSPLCLENAPGVWDGALPFVGGGPIVEHGNTDKIKGAQTMSFASMFNCQRILDDQVLAVADAMAPGGHGNPFEGLDSHQRAELAMLYALGFPRGDEFMIAQPGGQMWLWTSMADTLEEQDPSYFENFWTKPGYIGFDQPELVVNDVINTRATVTRLFSATDVLEDPRFLQPEFQNMRIWVPIMAAHANSAYDVPMVVELDGIEGGYPLGSGVRILTGKATGRQLYAQQAVGNVFFCDGEGDANLLRFTDVLPGDEVLVDNRKFLAYHYFARHHLMDDIQFDALRVDGVPIYPQHPVPLQSALMGVGYSGRYEGKLIWVHHTHDSSLWPPQGIIYRDAVLGAQGEDGARERFRLRWIENAEHGPAIMMPSQPNRASHTWLIDYMPFIEQSIKDLIAWVEHGVDPAETVFDFHDNRVVLSPEAGERRGIQATIAVSANDVVRAEVKMGEPVSLELRAAVPPGADTIVDADWDFDGTGIFPFRYAEVDGTATALTLSTTHTFDRPGEYFVTGRVHTHREGDLAEPSRRIANMAQARVVVS